MKINLILPTYNNYELTLKCLETIKKYEDPNYEVNIIWIDNNSNFDDRKIVFNYLKKNEICFDNLFLSKNLGFIKAVNIGLKFALEKYKKNKYIGIINNDIIVSENWLKNLILPLAENDNLMLAGSISYNSIRNSISFDDILLNDELNEISSNSFENTIYNLKNCKLNKKIHIFDFDDIKDLNNTLVPYYSVIFKTSIFKSLGFLNENFNMGYSDDTEFNFRILENGYNIVKVFNSIVLHNSRSTFKLFNNNINNIQNSNRLQLKISKSLNKSKEKKYVIYTCISGDYDNLKSLTNINTKLFDYICFTNSEKIASIDVYPWKIINIKDIEHGLNLQDENLKDRQVKFARFIKTHPHLFFENYEKSIWIDANIDVIGDAEKYIELLTNEHYLLVPDHPYRNNIYEEISACIKLKKDDPKKLNYVNKFLLNENFPKNTFLTQTGVLVRDHNDEKCKFLMERWWEMIRDFSRRDQLSFNYVFWKHGGKYLSLSWDLIKISYFITDYKHNEVN